jgi:hypothetical protein
MNRPAWPRDRISASLDGSTIKSIVPEFRRAMGIQNESSFQVGEWRVEPRVMELLVYLPGHAGEVVSSEEPDPEGEAARSGYGFVELVARGTETVYIPDLGRLQTAGSERYGLSTLLDRWVVERALQWLAKNQAE